MRITTRAIMQGYNRDLTNALYNWNKAQNTVLTQRNFNTIAEDPSGATRSFKLRQQFRTNNMQTEMAEQANSLLDQAVSSAMQISDILCNTVNKDIISAANATNMASDVRASYAAALRGMRDSIVLASNSQISGRYIFGGASTKDVPFEMDADGNLTYRGINVDAGDMDLYLHENGDPYFLDANGDIIDTDQYDTINTNVVYKDANGKELAQGTDYDTVDADGNLIKYHINEPVIYATKEINYTFKKTDGTELKKYIDYDDVDANGVPMKNGTSLTDNTDYDSAQTIKTPVFKDAEGNTLEYTSLDTNGEPLRTYDETIEYATKETIYTLEKDGNLVADDCTFKTTENADGEITAQEGMKKTKDVLDALAKESLYLDLGFGLEADANGNTIDTSAFNTAIPGISMLGYGKDENGLSNNVVVLLGQLADELEKEPFSEANYGKLMDKFSECIDEITDFEASLGTKQNFLDGTITRLEQYNDSLNDRIVDVERVDMAEAISTYTWMGYAYNAALKVGTDIVSNSLLDYMK